jgi:ADP-ribose pyrophosphatase
VIPLTDDGRVVLVRQYRFGTEDFTLEIPGGMCDSDESPLRAAAREMREETGFEARQIVPLGFVHPNPAIQTNRCHSYLARGARRVQDPTPDPFEQIEVDSVPLAEIGRLVREGAITHALVVTAFHLLSLRPDLVQPT